MSDRQTPLPSNRPMLKFSDARFRSVAVFAAFAKAILILLTTAVVSESRAEEVRIAVAANFLSTLNTLKESFESISSHQLLITSGSTGLLYAQIRNGAPFDLFLAADQERPRLLAAAGVGSPENTFTYAVGRLVLWSANPTLVSESMLTDIASADFRWLAIAQPDIAPYGIAARQTLEETGIWKMIQPRVVRGQNVAQAFSMVATGNAELGFVALSQVMQYPAESSSIVIPSQYHEPIRQDAIVLRSGENNSAVSEFVDFLGSASATEIIELSGYASAR